MNVQWSLIKRYNRLQWTYYIATKQTTALMSKMWKIRKIYLVCVKCLWMKCVSSLLIDILFPLWFYGVESGECITIVKIQSVETRWFDCNCCSSILCSCFSAINTENEMIGLRLLGHCNWKSQTTWCKSRLSREGERESQICLVEQCHHHFSSYQETNKRQLNHKIHQYCDTTNVVAINGIPDLFMLIHIENRYCRTYILIRDWILL